MCFFSLDGSSSQTCNNELIGIEELYTRAVDITAYRTRPAEQRVIPSINFTFHGVLKSWTFVAEWGTSGTQLPEIQVWRKNENSSRYSRVQSSNANTHLIHTGYLSVYQCELDPPLTFQSGDIVGIFQPPRDSSQLSILYSEEPTLANYVISTVSPLETIALSDNQIAMDDLVPLITIETGKKPHLCKHIMVITQPCVSVFYSFIF